MFVIKNSTKKIQISLLAILLLSLSLNCFSDSKAPLSKPDEHGIEYVCGTKCFSIDEVIFELSAEDVFFNDKDRLHTKILRFNNRFQQELKSLNTRHKVKIKTTFKVTNFLSSFQSEESILKVYVHMSVDKCDPSNIKFEVVSLSLNNIEFKKLECKKGDESCIDARISYVFEKYVLGNIREYIPPASIE